MALVDLRLGDSLDVLRSIPDQEIQCCVTSPPYWGLRDYGVGGQIGLEGTPAEYVGKMVDVFREVRRVLKDDGTLWLNLGDSYAAGGTGGRPSDKSTLGRGCDGSYRLGPSGRSRYLDAMGDGRQRSIPVGLKPKDLVGIPWRVAFALQADGWYLRSDIIWHKPNPMPESVTDRPTKAHEYVFLMSKSPRYYYDAKAIKEPATEAGKPSLRKDTGRAFREAHASLGDGMRTRPVGRTCGNPDKRNRRTVWTVTPKPFKGAHFATFPPALIEPCILAGSKAGDLVLDPFNGAGTTGLVALGHGRRYLGIDINAEYIDMTKQRLGLFK